jgi:WD40 repeat protein/Leucine-rich repeat (LRR) protein
MSSSGSAPPDVLGFLKANKGLCALGLLSALALGVYFWQRIPADKVVVHSLVRAGARVRQAGTAGGQLLYDVQFSGMKVGPEELSLVAKLPGTRSLDLSGTGVGDAEMKPLTGLRSLAALHLAGTRVGAAGVKELRRLPNLQRLDLSRCAIGDDDLPVLAGFPALDDLNLSGTRVSDAGLGHLSGCARLSVLGLASTGVGDAGIPALAAVPRLADLDLSATRLTDKGLEALRQVAGLRALALRGTRITDAGLRHLQSCRRLQSLVLAMTRISDAGLRHLAETSQLESLDLGHTRIGDAGLAHLRDLPLRKLILSSTSITDAGMEVVGGFRLMRHLEIDGAPMHLPLEMARPEQLERFLKSTPIGWPSVTDEGVRHLRRLAALEVLRLSGSPITDAGLESLAGLRALRDLHLWGARIGDAGLAHLAGLTELRRLYLGGAPLSGSGLAALSGLQRLEELGLQETDVGDEHVAHLAALRSLTMLDLSGTPIGDAALPTLGKLTGLHRLFLRGTRISDAGLAHLKGLSELRNLGIDDTEITDAGLKHLAALPSLEEVNAYQTAVSKSLVDAFLLREPPVRVLGHQEAQPRRAGPEGEDWQERLDPRHLDFQGDPLPEGARARLGTARLYCRGQSMHLALTPDGKTLVAGSEERVTLWSTRDGRLLHALPRGEGGWRALALAPDGRLLAVAAAGGRIELWNTADGTRREKLSGPWTVPTALTFSPDGKSLAVVSIPGAIHVLDVGSGKRVLTLHGRRQRRQRGLGETFGPVVFSPDGKTFAVSSFESEAKPVWQVVNGRRRFLYLTAQKSTLRLWDWPTGKPRASLPRSSPYSGVAYAEGGRSIVDPAKDGSLHIWDVATGQKVRRLACGGRNAPPVPLTAPDGQTVLVSHAGSWARWDVRTGRQGNFPAVPGGFLTCSANGKVLATVQNEGHLLLWDAVTGKELVPLARHQGLTYPRPVAYAPDGKTIATAGREQAIRLWERSGRSLRVIPVPGHEPAWLSFSPDGRLLAASLLSFAPQQAGWGKVRVWEAQTARVAFETPAKGWEKARAMAPVLGPDGLLAVGRVPLFAPQPKQAPPKCSVVLYDLRTGKERTVEGGSLPIDTVALSPTGRLLAWAANRGEVAIVETSTLRPLRRLPLPPRADEEGLESALLLFSPDDKQLAVGLGSKGTLLVPTTGTGPVRTIAPAGKQSVRALRFHRGRLLAVERAQAPTRTGHATDLSVRDVESGQPLRPPWRTKEVLDALLAPDGAELATTHESGEVVLWGIPGPGKEEAQRRGEPAEWAGRPGNNAFGSPEFGSQLRFSALVQGGRPMSSASSQGRASR